MGCSCTSPPEQFLHGKAKALELGDLLHRCRGRQGPCRGLMLEPQRCLEGEGR